MQHSLLLQCVLCLSVYYYWIKNWQDDELASATSGLLELFAAGYGFALGSSRAAGAVARSSAGADTAGAAHQATDERVHGVVEDSAQENCPGKSKDAQLWDIEEIGRRVEDPDGGEQEAVHRRGQETQGDAHEGAPGLQVSPAQETKGGSADDAEQEQPPDEQLAELPEFPIVALLPAVRLGVASSPSVHDWHELLAAAVLRHASSVGPDAPEQIGRSGGRRGEQQQRNHVQQLLLEPLSADVDSLEAVPVVAVPQLVTQARDIHG